MVWVRFFSVVLVSLALLGCERSLPFANYQQEFFDVTPITGSQLQIIKLVNPEKETAQHISGLGFDAGGNPGEHFSIEAVKVGDKDVARRDISVPPGASLEIHVRYTPQDLDTTQANFGGMATGQPERVTPQAPREDASEQADESAAEATGTSTPASRGAVMAAGILLGGKSAPAPQKTPATRDFQTLAGDALHRALLVLIYDYPQEGILQVEFVGTAIPGPQGELVAAPSADGGGVATGECTAGGTTACFAGDFSINLPGLMKEAVHTELTGAWPITIDGGTASADMGQFPLALFVVQGNGPGEPLEGQPISALSIAISGDPHSQATGTFDGSSLTLTDAGFRIRIYFSAMSVDGLASNAAPAEFIVDGLTIETRMPLADGTIGLGVESILEQNPSGNLAVDPLLSGATFVVDMQGTLTLP